MNSKWSNNASIIQHLDLYRRAAAWRHKNSQILQTEELWLQILNTFSKVTEAVEWFLPALESFHMSAAIRVNLGTEVSLMLPA